MRNKLLISGLALVSLSAAAQELHDGDILWPNSQKLYDFVQNWTPGKPVKVTSTGTSVNPSASGEDFIDENFFISRVKLKPLFRNTKTQVDETYVESNDKRLLNWVPVNKADGGHTDALPNGVFDSEVFSNWSYVYHWGDWISPHGWVPAALADAAHKHGVLVSGVASIPWGGLSGEWSTALSGLANLSAANQEKLAQFLYFHGVNGLGYNSEFTGFSAANMKKLRDVHTYVNNWMADKGVRYENPWYDFTGDEGTYANDRGYGSHNDDNYKAFALFMNYNWNNNSRSTFANAPEPIRIYAGHNMQGGEPHANTYQGNWAVLKNLPISIGLWGAHNTNLLWSSRSANGSSPATMQDSYQKRNEQWFTNGNRNPVKKIAIYNRENFSPDDKWFGLSAYMTARSSLCWDLADEPFITYFNLGNGTFLNWKGERQNNNEWYNLGVQDYMPTWRWWFTDKFLGKDAKDVPAEGLDAQFIWKDAWMGGSCLNIYGSTDEEYLHLFKTQFDIEAGDKITVRYKLMGGKADAKLIFSLVNSEDEPIDDYEIFDTTQEVDDEWVVKTFEVGNRDAINGSTIAMIALGFENAENLNLYLGELSIVRKDVPAPKAPQITHAEVLRNNYYGVDAKVIFNMENTKEAKGEPCYNIDVNTSLFKLYAEVDGKTHLMGITSSWAGLMFSIPVGDAKTVKLGVQAVSTDFKTESAITWSDAQPVGTRTISEDVVLSQSVIKPNEAFTVGYLDPAHAPATKWEVIDANDPSNVVGTANNATQLVFEKGLPNVGPYNVVVTEANGTRSFNWMVQITNNSTGAVPRIDNVTINGKDQAVTIEPGDVLNVAYTGREADGAATRAISAEERWIGGNMESTGLAQQTSFTVAAWVKYTFMDGAGSSCFFSIEDRTMAWPQNNWGWFWSNLDGDGSIGSYTFRTSYTGGSEEIKFSFPNTKIPMDTWTHVAIVFDYQNSTSLRSQLYINGIKQEGTWTRNSGSGNTDDYFNYNVTLKSWEKSMWFSFFGGRGSNSIPGNGLVDDLQIWNKALTADEVEKSMKLDRKALPAELLCYWDFETQEEYNYDDYTFSSLGTNRAAKASNFALVKSDGEGQAVQTPQIPEYAAGNPFLAGEGYKVTTKPTWTGRRATISDEEGTGAKGSAKVTYTKGGDYTLTLTLANDYGTATKEYPLITVNEADGVADVVAESDLRTYTVDDVLYVAFGDNGDYQVSVYNLGGVLVAQRAEEVVAGQTMRLTLGTPGVYVVRVVKNNREVKAFKVVRK